MNIDELKATIKKAAPYATAENLDKFTPLLHELMPKYGIDTPLRQRHFLAQLLHESGSFRYVREIADGKAYEGRKDLGNTFTGYGTRFRGRGLIQVTGRYNYEKCSTGIFNDSTVLMCFPEMLEQTRYAVESACWFWKFNNINSLADKDDIIAVTKKINGGTNGLEDRKKYFAGLLDLKDYPVEKHKMI